MRSDQKNKALYGGFHLVDLIITELKDHMICYKLECSHWWKIYLQKNPLQDFLSSMNAVFQPMRGLEFQQVV